MDMRRKDGKELPETLSMAACKESIQAFVEFVCEHAREAVFEETRIDQIRDGIEEAIHNIIMFDDAPGIHTITVTCNMHDTGDLLVDIIDNGRPFNMLVAGLLPESVQDGSSIPETAKMKRLMKNIEYRRDARNGRNILAFAIVR